MNRWIEAFTILAKYGAENHDVYAEHDMILVGTARAVSEEDAEQLEKLLWHQEDEDILTWYTFV